MISGFGVVLLIDSEAFSLEGAPTFGRGSSLDLAKKFSFQDGNSFILRLLVPEWVECLFLK
jgi:hypothetical protein